MRVLVIVNPVASNGRAKRDYEETIEVLLKKYLGDFDTMFTTGPGEATEFAAKGDNYDRVISVGGDGTLNEVVNGLMRCKRPPSLGIIGVGTGNDYMKTIGLGGSYEDLVRIASGNEEKQADVFLVSYKNFEGETAERYCVNVVGAGFDAAITERMNNFKLKLRGKISYLLAFLIEFVRARPYGMNENVDGVERNSEYFALVLGNGKFFGGGMKICPDAELSDGIIDLVGLRKMPKGVLLYHFPKIYKGTHIKVKHVEHKLAKEVSVHSAERVPMEMDGEVVGTLPIKVSVVGRALTIASH